MINLSLLILFLIIPLIAGVILLANKLLAVNKPDAQKRSTYECGFEVFLGQTRHAFKVGFYCVGIVFLLLDVEVAVLFPLAVTLNEVSFYGFTIGMLFFCLLTLGLAYEWFNGVLLFTNNRSDIHTKTT